MLKKCLRPGAQTPRPPGKAGRYESTLEGLRALQTSRKVFVSSLTCGLPQECLDCPYVRLCFGGCPKDRLSGGRNYLCDGYRRFFARVVADWNAGG